MGAKGKEGAGGKSGIGCWVYGVWLIAIDHLGIGPLHPIPCTLYLLFHLA